MIQLTQDLLFFMEKTTLIKFSHFLLALAGVLVVFLLVLAMSSPVRLQSPQTTVGQTISNFEECVEAGNPVMESYPRQCRVNGETFVEYLEPTEPSNGVNPIGLPGNN
jgi:hypothetical protein